jgi:BirA family biotin operon repressor/biotin-[acetyl-CoA-carboxylase] ligase
LVAILEEIETRYHKMCAGWSPHQEWREHLATLGQLVCVTGSQGSIEGVAEDVDQDGALLVRTGDGELRRVLADDVTLRGRAPLRRTPPTPG